MPETLTELAYAIAWFASGVGASMVAIGLRDTYYMVRELLA